MRDFADKVAVVTGAASGVGRALATRFAREGMRVVLSDVEKQALDGCVASLAKQGMAVSGVVADVSDADSVESLAQQAYALHGVVHVLCNNAGVGTDETQSRIWDSPDNDWTWAFRVNVWGVLNGIRSFVPRMLAGGDEGHVVNTSSGNGGLYPLPTTPIYSTSKAAVTTISEVLNYQLQMSGAKIKAAVLYPGPHIVNTNIFTAGRNRPADLPMGTDPAKPPPSLEDIRKLAKAAGRDMAVTEPEEVAEYTLAALREDRFWILPESSDADGRVRKRVEGIVERRTPTLADFA
jgi:NAD(P)-dependent dehydrogenase (short-subunit alcohol dehydrogenase family)